MQREGDNPKTFLGLIFCRVVTQALAGVCDPVWQAELVEEQATAVPSDEDAARFRFSFNGAIEGDAWLSLRQVDILTLGLRDLATGAAGDAQAAGLLGALQEVASLLPELLGKPGAVSIRMQREKDSGPSDTTCVELRAHTDGKAHVPVFLHLSRTLVASVELSRRSDLSSPSNGKAPTENLDLVLDVELNATLRFGERRLSLREVLELTSGSVVELDRQVEEPVELILDGRIVARGEAVIIDGNYGMRITQVLSRVLP